MRTVWLLLALALILPAAGCDTTQPTDAGERLVSISLTGAARVSKYRIWDVWIDVDGNCRIDEPPDGEDYKASYLYCEERESFDTTVPWPYSAEVAIIRAGTTQEEIIATSVGTANEFSNLSPYDERIIQQLPNRPCSGVPNGPLYVEGREVSAAREEVMTDCLNKRDLLPVNILGQSDPAEYVVTVKRGDTIIFRSRKSAEGDSGPYDDIVETSVNQTAMIAIDGVEVVPQGNVDTGNVDMGGISISLRLR